MIAALNAISFSIAILWLIYFQWLQDMSPICVIIMFSSAGVTLDASYNVQLDLDPCFCLCRLTPKIGLGGKLKSYFVHFLAVKGGKVSRFPGGQVTGGGGEGHDGGV